MTSCQHRRLITACITCGRTPGHHSDPPCLCQDFRDNVCARCFMLVNTPPPQHAMPTLSPTTISAYVAALFTPKDTKHGNH